MTSLHLYDDIAARGFEPFALTRPVSELRAGTDLIRARWASAAGRAATSFIAAPHLVDFSEAGAPRAHPADGTLPAGAIIANSRFVVALATRLHADESAWSCDGAICAVRLARGTELRELQQLQDGALPLDGLAGGMNATRIDGRWIAAPWDLIATLTPQVTEDIAALAIVASAMSDPGVTLGQHPVVVETGANVEPYVVFDAAAGPIFVSSGATISAFTRIVGPCFIGTGTVIAGDRIANCSIGEKCKIRGEISSSIVLGHSNKGHTGFVGHSYLGRWVNLGAGTTTSNLKNTYGTVQMWTPAGMVDTAQQFLGTLFGDHVKTGIGTMLTTGTVLGAGANVYGAATHPKYVAPFAWGEGEPYSQFKPEKFLDVAVRVMQRRGVSLDDAQRRHLARAHARATGA